MNIPSLKSLSNINITKIILDIMLDINIAFFNQSTHVYISIIGI